MSDNESERSRSRSPVGKFREEKQSNSSESSRPMRDKRRNTTGIRSGRRAPAERRVYVSNIPYEYKWQSLKDLFRTEVGEVTYVEMFKDEKDRPRGCAIIEFANEDDARRAVDIMHKYDLNSRKLVVKEDFENIRDKYGRIIRDSRRRSLSSSGNDRGGIVPPPSLSVHHEVENTYGLSKAFLDSLGIDGSLVNRVFVANLDYKVTEDMLKSVFAIAGKVIDVRLHKDNDGNSRGFGIIEFEHPVEAVQAVSMLHNQTYLDRKLIVRIDKVEKESSSKLPPGLQSIGMGLGIGGTALSDISSLPSFSKTAGGKVNPLAVGLANGGNSLITGLGVPGLMGPSATSSLGAVGNLSGLGALGGGVGGNLLGRLGSSLGNSTIGGAPAPMNENFMAAARRSNLDGGSLSQDLTHGYSSDNTFLGVGRSCTVQISNLPSDCDWQNLRSMCRAYGEVRYAAMKSSGIGLVRFMTEEDAQKAAHSLDRQRYEGRFLEARIV